MKINAIKKLCEDEGVYYLFNIFGNGSQWISNGRGAWPVDGVRLSEGLIPALFDIDGKKMKKLAIWEREYIDARFSDVPMDGEKELTDLGVIWDSGRFYRALTGEDGLLMIDTALLKPAERKDEAFAYFQRDAEDKTPLVACYSDMLCGAVIVPEGAEKVMAILEKMNKICGVRLHPKCERKEEE